MKIVTKTYGHERGYSTCFRQWRAKSHCRFLHGYALSFSFVFACEDWEVDENGWVIDFGSLKPLKAFLDDHFDHKLLVAADDPQKDTILRLSSVTRPLLNRDSNAIADVLEVSRVGCEAFAEHLHEIVTHMINAGELGATKAQLIEVEVSEHGSNSASYIRIFEPRTNPNGASDLRGG